MTPLKPFMRKKLEKREQREGNGCRSCPVDRKWARLFWPQADPGVLVGSYFARDAAYSHHYSKTDTNTHAMLLARVLVGEFVRGSTAYVRPPIKEAQGNILYDSCVNSMSEPSIFVIFEKHQAYPEYVIQYTASTKPPAAAPTLLSLASFFSGRQ